MRSCFDILAQAANSDASVLIAGETGTGKELFARAIHENSPRANRNFVVVDCTALPKTLVESTLFGYERGAFTGADRDQEGLVRQAHGGTLFLDEVGELPLVIQKAFLRVLQEHRFRPVGSKKEIESDFRLVAATNRVMDEMVESRRFRRDLLFRLQTFTIDLPPLRERKEDIRELVMYHMAKLSERYGIGTKGFAPEFLDSLIAYEWPGNVRELVNAVERALTMARQEPTLFAKHLPTHIRVSLARAAVTKEAPSQVSSKAASPPPLPPLKGFREAALQEAERQYLEDLMGIAGSNIKDACRISGLSRPRLYALMKKYRISRYG
jgi:two-component system NtrC family response regulator